MYNKKRDKGRKKNQMLMCGNSKTELKNLDKISFEMTKLNASLTVGTTTFFRKTNVSVCTSSH